MAPARQDSSGTVKKRRHSPTFLFLMSLSHATESTRAELSAPCRAHQVLHGCLKRSQLTADKEEGGGGGRERREEKGKKNVATYLKINYLFM